MNAAPAAPSNHRGQQPREPALRHLASGVTAVMAIVYLAIYAGVLSVGRAEAGELGVLGVAGAIFVVLAVLLWVVRSRILWGAVALLQLMMGLMYLGVAPEREPAYEVWGVSLRALSVVLVGALIAMLLAARRTDDRDG